MNKPTLNQVHKIISLVEQSGIDSDTLQKFIDSGRLTELLREFMNYDMATYCVTIDGHHSLEDMITAGKYDWVGANVTSKHFPFESHDPKVIQLKLLQFPADMKVQEMLKELEILDLCPATLVELCALGVAYPDLQRRYCLIALGSRLRRGGNLNVPILRESAGKRRLNLSSRVLGYRNHDNYRFLAFEK